MMRVPHPIHQAKRRPGKESIAKMILYHSDFRYAPGFPQENAGIERVVENVHKHHNVKGGWRKRKRDAVESVDANCRLRPNEDIHSFNGDVGPLAKNLAVDRAIAATHVENSRILWEQRGEMTREDAYTPSMN